AGADTTYSIELVMPDGKALQAATSHHLGQNFGKAFGVEFSDENGEKQIVQQTSWGFSTRSIGGLILTHGDDSGMVVPPKLAMTQVVVLPVSNKDAAIYEKIKETAQQVKDRLAKKGIRVVLD